MNILSYQNSCFIESPFVAPRLQPSHRSTFRIMEASSSARRCPPRPPGAASGPVPSSPPLLQMQVGDVQLQVGNIQMQARRRKRKPRREHASLILPVLAHHAQEPHTTPGSPPMPPAIRFHHCETESLFACLRVYPLPCPDCACRWTVLYQRLVKMGYQWRDMALPAERGCLPSCSAFRAPFMLHANSCQRRPRPPGDKRDKVPNIPRRPGSSKAHRAVRLGNKPGNSLWLRSAQWLWVGEPVD